MSPNRVVAVLTPLVFAPLAGAVTSWLAENAPGLNVSQDDLTTVFIAGALIALAPAVQWLHGWQKYEAREGEIQRAVELANAASISAAPAPIATEQTSSAIDDFVWLDHEFDDEFYDLEEFEEAPVAGQEEPLPTGD
ncbi:MAG: hypothetical protein ACRDKZ_05165 [Actinomycetota bacterium]